jgi:hypothetical protein
VTHTVFDRSDGSRVRSDELPIPHTGVGISNLEPTYLAARD